uniref:GINS subunit domain-containing protein n=1 Tax=Aegilops tauschii subsp. strangulata TaxID=200361 RepID=A0A453G6V7_AEGTS
MSSWEDEDSAAASAAATTDVELLKRAWRNEKAAPEILHFDSALVSRAREQIQLLEETLDDFTDNGVDDLVVSLYQMDLDRTLFLLRSYLRLRLQKIEKYMFHIANSEDLLSRLSQQEQRFAKSCKEIMEKHLEQSVLSKLPYGYDSVTRQSLSSTEDDMGIPLDLEISMFLCHTLLVHQLFIDSAIT